MPSGWTRRWAAAATLAVASAASPAAGPAPAVPTLTRYESKYYTIYTDLDRDVVREASARMTHMVDEYLDRTRSFTGGIRHRFPFYLYRSEADYRAAGGVPRSTGFYVWSGDGTSKLMAFAGDRITDYTWHTVQHEGFHQFVHEVIRGDFPTWLNEGLAEYFGESLYTGDGFVTGVVPPWRLQRLRGEIAAGTLRPLPAIMAIPADQWQSEMSVANYDQVWSMVYFLVHADGGRYLPTFGKVIREISQGRSGEAAWRDVVGSTTGFEDRWKAYWLAQPDSPTHALYQRATVATLTSFLARATARRQAFPDLASFARSAAEGTLKVSPDDWLPPSLLANAMREARFDTAAAADDAPADAPKPDTWELKRSPARLPTLTLIAADGTRMTGWFTLNGTHVAAVNVDVDDTAKVLADAAVLRDGGKKEQARAMVQAALRSHPKSPSADDARAFVKALR